MIANYGYADGGGEFYITIDTGACASCDARPCIKACPAALLVEEEDPYGDVAIAVEEPKRKKLRYECTPCKAGGKAKTIPCVDACPFGAISHSW
ncbi:MAG: ferredoxin [Deltaproteobacteria bacterium]|nr:MAG: ferredoxin [Deltaproteobacteria bacterium]